MVNLVQCWGFSLAKSYKTPPKQDRDSVRHLLVKYVYTSREALAAVHYVDTILRGGVCNGTSTLSAVGFGTAGRPAVRKASGPLLALQPDMSRCVPFPIAGVCLDLLNWKVVGAGSGPDNCCRCHAVLYIGACCGEDGRGRSIEIGAFPLALFPILFWCTIRTGRGKAPSVPQLKPTMTLIATTNLVRDAM